MYLFTEKKNFWMAAVPATFMSAVSCTYFILAPECLGSLLNSKTADGTVIYNTAVAYPIGIVFAGTAARTVHPCDQEARRKEICLNIITLLQPAVPLCGRLRPSITIIAG